MSSNPSTWLFAYGSLIWRPDFPFVDRRPGCIRGWSRRLWQGSTDHRGVPSAPGRVATLVDEPDAVCWGVAYALAPRVTRDVFARLDHREKGGYERHRVPMWLRGDRNPVDAALYIAGRENPEYLGDAPLDALVTQVAAAVGPSGTNREYVVQLAASLRALDAEDPHVFAIEAALLHRSR